MGLNRTSSRDRSAKQAWVSRDVGRFSVTGRAPIGRGRSWSSRPPDPQPASRNAKRRARRFTRLEIPDSWPTVSEYTPLGARGRDPNSNRRAGGDLRQFCDKYEIDTARSAVRVVGGPRCPNAARALCKERLYD